MKKYLLVVGIICLLLCAIPLIARISYHPTGAVEGTAEGLLLSAQNLWYQANVSDAAGYEPNDLAVAERTYATVIVAAEGGDAKISTNYIPPTWNGIRFRCLGISDNNSVTYQIYLGTLGGGTDCDLAKVGQLAFTIGTQASTESGYELADAVTVTSYDWSANWASASPGNNQVAEGRIDALGADRFVAVPTVIDCNCILIIKGY